MQFEDLKTFEPKVKEMHATKKNKWKNILFSTNVNQRIFSTIIDATNDTEVGYNARGKIIDIKGAKNQAKINGFMIPFSL